MKARKLFGALVSVSLPVPFYLAGGTALALHYGHRQSVDFDWFSQKNFAPGALYRAIAKYGTFTVLGEAPGTLHGKLRGVRLSYLLYPYPLLWPKVKYQAAYMADPREIACMKLKAISSRGSRKDFVDMFFLLQHYSLSDIFSWFKKKYQRVAYDPLHLLKSLTYFTDAEEEPNPVMLIPISWSEVKNELQRQSNAFIKKI